MLETPIIALYLYSVAGMAGGAERMICRLAEALRARGFAVVLITLDPPNSKSFYPLNSEIKWVRLGYAPGLADKIRRTVTLFKTLRRLRVDILIGFVVTADRSVLCATKFARVKLVVAERNSPKMYEFRHTKLGRLATIGALFLADRVMVQQESFVSLYPRSLQSRIKVIPNPVSPAANFARPDCPNARGRYVLLAVSRLDPLQKRLAILIEAFAKVANDFPAWDLRIIGDGPAESDLHQLVGRSGLSDRVVIECSRKDIESAYSESHLYAIPSLWEGFPNALAEALAQGLPAVGFRGASGVSDLINPECGWLADGSLDSEAFARALREGMADSRGRVMRGHAAVLKMRRFEAAAIFDEWGVVVRQLYERGV